MVHKSILDIFVKLCNLNNYEKLLSLVLGMDKTSFKLRDLKVNLCQFSTLVDSKVGSIGKIIELVSDTGKIQGQKHIMPEVLKSVKLFWVMPATNARAIIFCN